jgi:phosphoenolpyruvate carboxykinase (GTP)
MIWLLWAELRVNGDVDAIKTPTGWIPKYEDLAPLFKSKLNADYTQEAYIKQFSIRVPSLIAKYDRVEAIYRAKVSDTPQVVYDTFAAIRKRLQDAQAKYGDTISPLSLK